MLAITADQAEEDRKKAWLKACDVAAAKGDLQALRKARDSEFPSPMTTYTMEEAAYGGFLHVLQYLWMCNVPVTTEALMLAVRNGHVEAAKYLLERGAEPTQRAMCEAACSRSWRTVELMHSTGLEIRDVHVYMAWYMGEERVLSYVRQYKGKEHPIPATFVVTKPPKPPSPPSGWMRWA
jgi:hypothetical protein